MLAFLLDRQLALPDAYSRGGDLNPLMYWIGDSASELGVDDWYRASDSAMVLTVVRCLPM